MAPHRVVPLALLAVLVLLTLGFAVLALTMAPNSADLAVHNGTDETFSAQQFSIQLTDTEANAHGTAQSSVRVIDYTAPNRLVVYRASPKLHLLGSVHGAALVTAINEYAAITGGSTGWVRHGSHFDRTETLAAYAQRLGQKAAAAGTVAETAVVRSGYLVADSLILHIKSATGPNGQTTAGGTAQETLHVLRINGAKAPAINS
jgi:hypothetical protein